jgi:putative membrane protein insertion efficiency factor
MTTNRWASGLNCFVRRPMTQPGTSWLKQIPRQIGRAAVLAYRYGLSPLLGPNCRHLPGCSEYAEEAFSRFGLWAGGWMTLARLLRCQPWGTAGRDFVPQELSADARWWMPWRYGRWRGTNAAPPDSRLS